MKASGIFLDRCATAASRAVLLLAVAAAQTSARASDSDSDWRLYAYLPSGMVKFYSVPSVVRSPENEAAPKRGTVKVWTEDLPFNALDRAAELMLKDKEVMDLVAGRVAAYYLPPYFEINALPTGRQEVISQVGQVASFEVAANGDKVPPKNVALIEIDCAEAKQRILNALTYGGPQHVAKYLVSQPTPWIYTPPHSVGETLQKLVCDKSWTAPDNTPVRPKGTVGK
jgi:hypothetical protein